MKAIFNKHKKKWWPLIFTILGIIILLALGFWQLARMTEKEDFLSNLKTNLNNPPIEFETVPPSEVLSSKVIISGHFLSGNDIHLYGQRSGSDQKNGYYLLSPFQTDDNKIIMVARGWFSQLHKKGMINIKNQNHQDIVGVALRPEKQRIFIPHNDLKNNVWFTLDLSQMARVMKMNLEKYYILSFDDENLPHNLKPISSQSLLAIRNDHLQYALTWFALALSLGIVYIVYSRQR